MYNIKDGDEGGTLPGKDCPMYGRTHSKESLLKISKALKGKPLTKEHRQKMIDFRTGKHHSDEIKQKISLSLKGRIPWNKGRTIACQENTL
jgi:hypothetical protein